MGLLTRSILPLFVSLAFTLSPTLTLSKVIRITVERQEDVLNGRSFGSVGPYEKITGKVLFAFGPTNTVNTRIVDLDKAPRSAEGHVEAWANFLVLRPKNLQRRGGTALLEVSNRGRKASLPYFNGARWTLDPRRERDFGDGFLMRLGLTIIWVGWQHDVPLREGLLRLHVPVATNGDQPIEGLVRSDWTVDRPTKTLALGHRNHIPYPVSDPNHPDNVLTVRDGRLASRRTVSRNKWRFARAEGGGVVEDRTRIYMESGFEAGKIYELVYRSQGPKVAGLGLAAIRDMMSYAKYDPMSPVRVKHGIAIGISQTGRFLRHFLYQGFNTDEQGRKVFDGLMIHTAGAGRGSFNHRFAQPSRDAHRYSAFFFPTDLFPFTSRIQTDPETNVSDGLFAHLHKRDHLPKVFYTNTGYEYWGRAASLTHTKADGARDMELYPEERIYHLASGQHFVGPFPPSRHSQLPGSRGYRGNPLNFLYTMRALLVRMLMWVRDGTEPPPSAYPRIDAGTLVFISGVKFPKLQGVMFPTVAHEAYRVNYGPRWHHGIIDRQPPELGKPFPVLVPQVDQFGNELGGVRSIELLVPLATYTPWSLRTGFPTRTDELTDFFGTYIPLPKTEAARRETRDPRPTIQGLYMNKENYLRSVRRAARFLVEQGFLLQEDVPKVVALAEQHWDWLFSGRSSADPTPEAHPG
ncbi:MAG: alpha/beta hydrolase domain-containing protein [Candidatus Methylomirabilales bacterium]